MPRVSLTWARYGHDWIAVNGRYRLERLDLPRIGRSWHIYRWDEQTGAMTYVYTASHVARAKAWAAWDAHERREGS